MIKSSSFRISEDSKQLTPIDKFNSAQVHLISFFFGLIVAIVLHDIMVDA